MAKKTNKKAKATGPIGDIARTSVLAHYAASQNFNQTGREFGIHPMKVKRIWDSASPSEKKRYLGTADDSATIVAEAIIEHNVEWDQQQRRKLPERD